MSLAKLSTEMGDLSLNLIPDDFINAKALSKRYPYLQNVSETVLAMFNVENRIQRIKDNFRQFLCNEIISQVKENGEFNRNVDDVIKLYAEAFLLVTSIAKTDFSDYPVLAEHYKNQYEVYDHYNSQNVMRVRGSQKDDELESQRIALYRKHDKKRRKFLG